VIADGENCEDLVRGEPSARYIHFGIKHSIGAKRNLGCEAARGEIIAHWDDDDYSAPGRLEDQVRRILTSGKAVTGYNSDALH
jgi:glycosyltransferase involved in cell wall biosynthesis